MRPFLFWKVWGLRLMKADVVLVGRTNVGKSTLYNRLVGRNKAITDKIEYLTRDIQMAEVKWQKISFMLADSGGLDFETLDIIHRQVTEKVIDTIQKSHCCFLLHQY